LFFKEDYVRISRPLNSIPLQPSGQRDIPSGHSTVQSSFIRTTRTFRPDLPLFREASNCSILHPSGRLSSTSKLHSVFDQLCDFFPKHDVDSLLEALIHKASRAFKSRRLDNSFHGPDARASYMKIACVRSTIWTTDAMVRTR